MSKEKCNGCLEEIPDNDSYFFGHWVPECDENGIRKFGCAADQKYCKGCFSKLIKFTSHNNRQDMQCKYGSVSPIRFLRFDQVKLYDTEGNQVFCSCGKPAGCAIIGIDESVALCCDCFDGNEDPEKFVYRPPQRIPPTFN